MFTVTDKTSRGYRAMVWGVITWLANIAGVLIGMVPIALPILILSTIATLGTGAWAMALGARARAGAGEDRDEAVMGLIGFWLGTSHLIIVCAVFAVVMVIVYDVGGVRELFGLRMP